MFIKIQLAYEILSDSDKRAQYDIQLDNGLDNSNSFDNMVELEKYKQVPFHLFALYENFIKFQFRAVFEKTRIPNIDLSVTIPVKFVFTGKR